MRSLTELRRSDFEAVPDRQHWDKPVFCTSLVVLPQRVHCFSFLGRIFRSAELHDSGYRFMTFVACDGQTPLCKVATISDVLHLDGIGGFGEWVGGRGVPRSIPPSGWCMDCLPRSGLLHLWPASGRIKCTEGLSSFEV